MYNKIAVGVIIRAYNEEKFISRVIESLPAFVDRIYVVNDASTDRTSELVLQAKKKHPGVILINRRTRGGAGSATISGHLRALQDDNGVIVTLDGDGQMDPRLISRFIDPIACGDADYVKGNRLSTRADRREMPLFRTIGNFILTNLTRIASGYWHISDPQNGYTAISIDTLRKLDLTSLEKGFAFENDMLVKLNVVGARVKDISHAAVYNGQRSKIRYFSFVYRTTWVLLKGGIWRIWVKYFKAKNQYLNSSIKNISTASNTMPKPSALVEKQNSKLRG